MSVTVVWFRRDLRLADNPALAMAKSLGKPIICLFNMDSARIGRPDVDPIHIQWELDCLQALKTDIEAIGGVLLFHFGDVVDKLKEIHQKNSISSIYGNQETGLQWSWDRDKSVSSWCNREGVRFVEFPTNGVIRKLESRDMWKKERDSRMEKSAIIPPTEIIPPVGIESDKIPDISDFGLVGRSLINRPDPGEKSATATLQSFLDGRGRTYRRDMSSPISAQSACSRLSPFISVGCISIRQILHHTKKKVEAVKRNPRAKENLGWTGSLNSFQSRLAWHCHFIQRLEVELTLDSVAMNPEIDLYLNRSMDDSRYQAWSKGETGWPFFDACMRSLIATGWINFRMRGMLQSVASYTLWLPWQLTGLHLARSFLDYEPGIHWSQVQMQSGVTGINSIRAYSISKQSRDQDPNGDFIRQWVEELRDVPTPFIHEPWLMDLDQQKEYGCMLDVDYPRPIVDEKDSRKEGISRSYSAKSKPGVKQKSRLVYKLHGSRKRQRSIGNRSRKH